MSDRRLDRQCGRIAEPGAGIGGQQARSVIDGVERFCGRLRRRGPELVAQPRMPQHDHEKQAEKQKPIPGLRLHTDHPRSLPAMRNHRAGAAGGTLEIFSEATKRDISRQLPLTIFLEGTFGDILGHPRLDRPIVHPFFGGRKRTFARLRHLAARSRVAILSPSFSRGDSAS